MKNRFEAGLAVLFLFYCLLWGCVGTQLHGWVYDANKEKIRNQKVEVKAEPGDRSTWIRDDGSFVLKGLKPEMTYSIIAICEADKTETRVVGIRIHKGKNELPGGKMLQVVCETPAVRPEQEIPESTDVGEDRPPIPVPH